MHSRRSWLRAGVMGPIGVALWRAGAVEAAIAQGGSRVDPKLASVSEPEKEALNRAWHRLKPWPDTVAGLTRLKKKFTIAPLSNGNIALMTDMAKHAGLPWDCILGAELVRHYKPDREAYQSAADFLALQPGEVMMVAAHLGDLRAAKSVGLKTAFVTRPLEYGPNGKADRKADEC